MSPPAGRPGRRRSARRCSAPVRAPRRRPRWRRGSPAASTSARRSSTRSRSSHASVSRSISIVRLALVTSVMCRPPLVPPVRFQMQPGVHVAEHQVAGLGLRARAVDVVEDPPDLRPREVGRQRQTDLGRGSGPDRRRPTAHRRACRCACPARRSRCAPARRCCGPTPRVVSRWLVMPERGDVVRRRRRPSPPPRRSPPGSAPRSPWHRARPSPAWDRSARAPSATPPRPGPSGQRSSPGSWSCPDPVQLSISACAFLSVRQRFGGALEEVVRGGRAGVLVILLSAHPGSWPVPCARRAASSRASPARRPRPPRAGHCRDPMPAPAPRPRAGARPASSCRQAVPCHETGRPPCPYATPRRTSGDRPRTARPAPCPSAETGSRTEDRRRHRRWRSAPWPPS